jgi:hypothetical protein
MSVEISLLCNYGIKETQVHLGAWHLNLFLGREAKAAAEAAAATSGQAWV